MSEDVHISSRIQKFIFGNESGDDSNHITSSHFVVEFLNYFASCEESDHVLYDSRYRQITSVLADADLASRIAADGFVMEMENNVSGAGSRICVCVSCKVEVSTPYNVNQRSQHHTATCSYRRLQQFCDGSLVLQTNDFEATGKLIDRLLRELVKTKVQVATELGFSRDLICTVLAEQLLAGRQVFQLAGCLVTALIEFEEKMYHLKMEPDDVCRGFSNFVDNYRGRNSIYRQPLRAAARKGPPSPTPSDHQDLMNETKTLLLQMFCKLCCKKNAEYVLLPCGHLSLCHSCSRKTSVCPVCEKDITELIRTYVS